jgi:hypothetical protein
MTSCSGPGMESPSSSRSNSPSEAPAGASSAIAPAHAFDAFEHFMPRIVDRRPEVRAARGDRKTRASVIRSTFQWRRNAAWPAPPPRPINARPAAEARDLEAVGLPVCQETNCQLLLSLPRLGPRTAPRAPEGLDETRFCPSRGSRGTSAFPCDALRTSLCAAGILRR